MSAPYAGDARRMTTISSVMRSISHAIAIWIDWLLGDPPVRRTHRTCPNRVSLNGPTWTIRPKSEANPANPSLSVFGEDTSW